MALPSVASLALPRPKLPKAVLMRPHPGSPPRRLTATRRVARTLYTAYVKICVDKKLLRSRPKFAYSFYVRFYSANRGCVLRYRSVRSAIALALELWLKHRDPGLPLRTHDTSRRFTDCINSIRCYLC